MLMYHCYKKIVIFTGKYDGYCIDLMHEIESMLNFTAEFHEVSDYGQMNIKDFTWSGAIGELVNKKSVKTISLHKA